MGFTPQRAWSQSQALLSPEKGDGDRVAAKAWQESCQHKEMLGRYRKWSKDIRKAGGGMAAPPAQTWEMLQGINSGVRCVKLERCSSTFALCSGCARQPRPWQRSPSSRSTQWAQTSAETFSGYKWSQAGSSAFINPPS